MAVTLSLPAQSHIEFESSEVGEAVLVINHLDTTDGNSLGITVNTFEGTAITGESRDRVGIEGQSEEWIGVFGRSANRYGMFGLSLSYHGASFDGANELGFADVVLQAGNWQNGDEGVLMVDPDPPSSDLFLVSNDAVVVELDENDDELGLFAIWTGANQPILQMHEDGEFEILNPLNSNDRKLRLTPNGDLAIDGTLTQGSDRNRKEFILPVDHDFILKKLQSMPIYEWQYSGQKRRHIGPMAQDFYKAFQLGHDDTSIAAIDSDGVALVAIQALLEKVEKLEKELQELNKIIDQQQ